MIIVTIKDDTSKSYTNYVCDGDKCYRQNMNYWEKGGYCVPQRSRKISKAEFNRMHDIATEVRIVL